MKFVKLHQPGTGNVSVRTIMLLIFYAVAIVTCAMRLDEVLAIIGRVFSVLFPFILGAMIAFVVNIPMRSIEKIIGKAIRDTSKHRFGGIRRGISMLLSFCLFFLAISVIMMLIIPEIGAAMVSLASGVPAFIEEVSRKTVQYFGENPQLGAYLSSLQQETEWQNILSNLLPFVKNSAGSVVESTLSTVSGLAGGVVTAGLALMFSVYILAAKEKLGQQAYRVLRAYLSDTAVEKTCRVAALISKTYSNYFAGQFTDACIFGFMIFVALTVCSMPYAMLIGVVVAMTALIPIVGAYIGLSIGAFLIAVVNPVYALYFVVIFLVIQLFDNNFIYPRVVGGSVGLPAIWVLLAVGVGGGLFGVIGMLLFIPGTSVIYQLIRENVAKRLNDKEIGKGKEEANGLENSSNRSSDQSEKTGET